MAEEPIPYDEALERILARCRPTPAEEVALAGAAGRVLAEPLSATGPLPAFANSAMDGFAVRAADLAGGPVVLHVREGGAAGRAPDPLPAGAAARVATGAPMPDGADAVVPIEDAVLEDGRVRLPGGVAAGRHVREPGSDVRAGEPAIPVGTPLGPGEGALLAALGIASLRVHRRPRVAVLSTGAELVPPEEPEPGPARIRDANSTALVWACRTAGAEVEALGIAPDEPGPLSELLARGLEADVLVTSGGVSVGERDLVREGLEALGVEPLFWRVDLRPGKPATAGVGPGGLALGLPGNPASALVGFELFVRPALRAVAGWAEPRPPRWGAVAGGAWPAPERRAHAIRVRRGPDGRVAPTGDQGSHRILSLVGAEALALIEPGREVRAGDAVSVLPAASA